jgi:hypothetical protein
VHKLNVIGILVLLLTSCDIAGMLDNHYYKIYCRHELAYRNEWKELSSYEEIATWIRMHVMYQTDTNNEVFSPEETLQKGYGDCEEFAMLFMNIAHISLEIKMTLVLVDNRHRTIEGGKWINHAEVRYLGDNFDIYSGKNIGNITVEYSYTFDEVFFQ